MRFRSIDATPEELAQIAAAFEKAWLEIDKRGSINALHWQAEKDRLAYIVAGLWNAKMPGDLAALAIAQFDASAELIDPAKPTDI